MRASGLRTVVLDLDGTLLANERARARAMVHLRGAYGIRAGRRFTAAHELWWNRFLAGEVGLDEMRLRRWEELGVPGESASEVDVAYRSLANAINRRQGVRRLLDDLRARGLKVVLLTNGDPAVQRPKLDGLLEQVDGAVVSGELGHHKPDRRAFEGALALVDGTPESSAMVGDTYEADIEGALAAGFARAVWVVRRPRPAPHPKVIPVTRLNQVVPALSLRR